MRIAYIIIISLIFLITGCGGAGETGRNRTANTPAKAENAPNAKPAEQPESGGGKVAFNALGSDAARKLCQEIDTGDTDILKNQTFAINFEPFLDSCFVTTHNPELDDPPLESEIAIYRDNERVFDFPGQFLTRNTLCWVRAVGFEDLNADNLVDVIVVGKCQAKMGDYSEAMVYANDSKTLTTNDTANAELYKFESIGAVAAFVRKNPSKFFNK